MKYFYFIGLFISLTACQSLPSLAERKDSVYLSETSSPALEKALLLPPLNSHNTRQPEKMEHIKQPETPASASTPAIQLFQALNDKYSNEPVETNETDTANVAAHQHITKLNTETRYPTDLYVLSNAKDAFAARIALIDHASRSIDAQYYIWRNDVSGTILLQKLYAAAQRGVRIRLLLDDNNTKGMDNILAALNAHPNIEIRLFNPFLYRKWRFIGYLTDFARLNRRMHNKSLTADNRASIVGGRNIGDEYFDIDTNTAFADMDVLVSGKIVPRISQEFDRYWQSKSAYPLESIIKIKPEDNSLGKQQLAANHYIEPAYANYQIRLAHAPLNQALAQGYLPYIHAQTQLISDDPAKALEKKVKIDIGEALSNALQKPKYELFLVSPYFVPTKSGTQAFAQLAKSGVNITVLTNSLRATDVAAVHSGYARYRKPLLHSNIALYEFKADNKFLTAKDKGLTGSSASSLHAKTFVVDKKRIFIGSFNLDPRSAKLNTEMGLVIYHAPLAKQMHDTLHNFTQLTAYHVTLDKQNHLQWYNPDTGQISHTEPEAGFWKRLSSQILSHLPIERLL